MKEEIKIMKHRNVFELVDKPDQDKILGNRWVFTTKCNEKDQVVRFKARLVAKGFDQLKGIHYDEVFSPVVNFAVIRLFFSILVSFYGWSHCQLDVKCAYLYAPISETIFMRQPQGFEDEEKPNHVWRLDKALYGLHQSGREWFGEIHKTLEAFNFKKLDWANCVYIFEDKLLLLLYVDDIVLFGRTQEDIKIAILKLESKFDVKVLGKTKKLLGVEFEETDQSLFMHQRSYIQKVCNIYKEYNLPICSLPIAQGTVLSKSQCPQTEDEQKEMANLPYRNVLGCLAFIASRTRPDITHAVNILSQFQSNPGIPHWNALIKLLGYVQQSKDLMLDLSGVQNLNIQCYADADFAANRDDRISLGGNILFVDRAPILWQTRKQKSVALSTMESEFMALTEASKEIVWIVRILKECSDNKIISNEIIPILFCDNESAINFSKSSIENHRTKHIHVRYHFLRNLVLEELFDLRYVNTKNNPADLFTKPQSKEKLKKFIKDIFS